MQVIHTFITTDVLLC